MGNYPTSLDSLTNPTASTSMSQHPTDHGNLNDAVEALQAKVGIGASTPVAGAAFVGTGTGSSAWKQAEKNALAYGVTGNGTTEDHAAIEALLELGGDIYFPEGDYLIGATVAPELVASVRVRCHPDARFFTDGLDGYMFRIKPRMDKVGIPTEGVSFGWRGGIFDQRAQCNGNAFTYITGYTATNPGVSLVGSALSVTCYSTDETYLIKDVRVEDVWFRAGDHWMTAGGDSGFDCDGGARVIDCRFDGHPDSAVYLNWNDVNPGVGDAQVVSGCKFRNSISGIAIKRGAERFSVFGNSFHNVNEGIHVQPISGDPDGGDSDERMNTGAIIGNTGIRCTQPIRLDWLDNSTVVGNAFRDFGSVEDDDTTLIPQTARSMWPNGVLLRGCTNVTVAHNVFLYETTAAKVSAYSTSEMIAMRVSSTAGASVDTSACIVAGNIGDSGWESVIYDEAALNTAYGNQPTPDSAHTTFATNGSQTISSTNDRPLRVERYATGTGGTTITLRKSKNATVQSHTAIGTNETMGVIEFTASGGSAYVKGAEITAATQSGTVSDTSMPSRLSFSTTADGASSPTERTRIDSTGKLDQKYAFSLSGVITPTQLAANTDNWNPTGLEGAAIIRASTDAARNLTGLAGTSAGREIRLFNVGAQNLILKHDVTSTAANRFYCPGSVDFTLNANDSCLLWYDSTSSRWRVIAA